MSHLFGCVVADADADARPLLAAMGAVLRCDPRQQLSTFTCGGFGLGVFESPSLEGDGDDLRPAHSADGRYALWMAGEAFASGDAGLPLRDCAASRTPAFRELLLDRWLAVGTRAIERLDGEYQIAIWDAAARRLTLVNDRFGGLPWYHGESAAAIGFAGGVRGVLALPGIDRRPDAEALKEAVTFGGYRLAERTNVAGVRMIPGGSIVSIHGGGLVNRRYWTWKDIQPRAAGTRSDQIDELHGLWRAAMARRSSGPGRFGQTLSGGLDSRAILAEGAPGRDWTAITYGLPGCDDAVYAQRAAQAVGARWLFQELYRQQPTDWLELRGAFIAQTDGLIQLGDLMHLECLDLQRQMFDVHVSGYVGDAVSGPTFASVATPEAAMHKLPWYSTAVGLDYAPALERVTGLADALNGAPPRFLLFEHKMPQATNRWTAAWRPWLRVRKPFLDYAFFDFCQSLPVGARVEGRLHEQWLRRAYPACFAAIPNQRTGLPVLAPRWRVEAARASRRGRALIRRALPAAWRPAPRSRSYHDDDVVWRSPSTARTIVDTILRRDSLCCEILGRARVDEVVRPWLAAAAAPAQVIGALYVYEAYHRDLAQSLKAATPAAPLKSPADRRLKS